MPSPAATLVLVRTARNAACIEAFMQQRAAGAVFPNAWVFPGGKLDATDYQHDWLPLLRGLDEKSANSRLGLNADGFAYWVAAIRETFEESGLLFAYDSGNQFLADAPDLPSDFSSAREQLNAGQINFLEFCLSNNLTLATDRLCYFDHWITPRTFPRRFDTRFFVASLSESSTGSHDDYELVNSRWIRPEEALKIPETQFSMIFPTRKTLEKLKAFDSVGSLMDHYQHSPSITAKEPVIRANPATGEQEHLLPGDPGYPF